MDMKTKKRSLSRVPARKAARPKSAKTGTKSDPITREIVRGALRSIQSEMEALIERTAMSGYIREKKDFHAAIFSSNGKLVQGKSKPSASDMITPVLKVFSVSSMKNGDIYLYNDCYAARGAVSHSPDLCLVAPVFAEGKLVAFSQSWAHFSDIGGMLPFSISPQCTEIFQEGMIIPPVKLQSEGKINDDLMRMFVRNCRFPLMAHSDMSALLAANDVGRNRIEELSQRFGADPVMAAFEELLARTSRVLKDRLRAQVGVGTYRFSDVLDDDGHGSGPIRLRWRLEVTPDRIVLDGSESDDQVKGPLNYLMNWTAPSMMWGLYLLGNSTEYAINSGAEDLFDEVILREGSIVQPRFPAALGMRGVTNMRNVCAWLGLMGLASGGKTNAAHSAYVYWILRGKDDNKEAFAMTDGIAVGYGGRSYADGQDAIYLSEQENYPVEFVEGVYPVRVRSYSMNRDSGGPGRWRGGCGIVREVEVLMEEGNFAMRMEGPDNPPWGIGGGLCARSGRCILNPGRPDERLIGPMSDGNKVRRGDVIRIESGGGGGWGHPYDREPWRVLNDVLSGFVSAQSAERDYGVVITASGKAVDEAATRERRSNRPEAKTFHRHHYCESME